MAGQPVLAGSLLVGALELPLVTSSADGCCCNCYAPKISKTVASEDIRCMMKPY